MTATCAGTREFAQKCLEEGYTLSYAAWTFWSTGWTCGGDCCNDEGLSVEEVLDTLEGFSYGKYENVHVRQKL